MLRGALAASLSIALLGSASSASAQPADVKQRAESTYREGIDLAKAGKNEAALKKFEESYASLPSGRASFQIAQMERALGRYKAALHDFREALADPALSTDERRTTESAIQELKQQIGIVSFDVPAGSTVTVDGIEVDSKAPVEVVAGPHEVRIHLGGDSRSSKVSCAPGKVTVVKLRFDEAPDNHAGPIVDPPVEAPRRGWSAPHVATTAGLGVLAIGAGVLGLVFRAQASSAVDDAREVLAPVGGCLGSSSEECKRAADLQSERDDKATMSTISFIGAGVFAAGALATAFFWPENRSSTSGRASTQRGVPRVSPAGLGAQVHILF